ncbi:hypothetical protein LA02_1617 [Francisella philomiragia]|uniref:hypothetical protein n=1 Tax=Francisella philomiragia TaxID=28110 RepID=UPI0005A56328|nr:hypothetical protein [Francisella philomiragia]AJI56562.1 hypothetical protein LA02_1617 [Francisella philomiragia]
MKKQMYAKIRHIFSRDLFYISVIDINDFIVVCNMTKQSGFVEKHNLHKYIGVSFKEVLRREYKDIKKIIDTLQVKYKNKYVANYIFSSIIVEVITNLQDWFDMLYEKFYLPEYKAYEHLAYSINPDQKDALKESTITRYHIACCTFAIIFFIKMKLKYFDALKWHEQNQDIYPIKTIKYSKPKFKSEVFERNCYDVLNVSADAKLNHRYVNIHDVIFGYFRKIACKKYQKMILRNNFDYMVYKKFNIDISVFIETHRSLKKPNIINIDPKEQIPIRGFRNILFSIISAFCSFAEYHDQFFYKLSKNITRDKKQAIDIFYKKNMVYLVSFLENIYNFNGENYENINFEYNTHEISGQNNPFIGKGVSYETMKKRIHDANIKSQDVYLYKQDFGVKRRIPLDRTDYVNKIQELKIYQNHKSDFFMEFFDKSNDLDINRDELERKLNKFWIHEGRLSILITMVLEKALGLKGSRDFKDYSDLNKDNKYYQIYKKEILSRFNYEYCVWLSYAADIYDL